MKTNPLYHMKKTLIIANWKSNKTKSEARNWIFELSQQKFPDNLEIVISPSFTLLDFLDSFIKVNDLPFKLGAQNISSFEGGPYTGEVSAKQIREFADYVLIGHSERRKNFSENDEIIKSKIQQAQLLKLTPIICVSDLYQLENIELNENMVLAFEPPGAISTSSSDSKAEDPSIVSDFAKKIKEKADVPVVYGGSIDTSNIKSYLALDDIDGVLVGGNSLDAEIFIDLIKNAV